MSLSRPPSSLYQCLSSLTKRFFRRVLKQNLSVDRYNIITSMGNFQRTIFFFEVKDPVIVRTSNPKSFTANIWQIFSSKIFYLPSAWWLTWYFLLKPAFIDYLVQNVEHGTNTIHIFMTFISSLLDKVVIKWKIKQFSVPLLPLTHVYSDHDVNCIALT